MARRMTKAGARLLETRAEYDVAIAEIERLLNGDPAPGSPEIARVEFLSLLVEHYDRKHFAMPGGSVTPREVVDFVLAQRGMSRSDLADVMGGRSRVSEFFNGKRALSTPQIVALRELLAIPADLLIEAAPRRAPGPSDSTSRARGAAKPSRVAEKSARRFAAKRSRRRR